MPPTTSWRPVSLVANQDFRSDLKPISRAHWASTLTWHCTVETLTACDPSVGNLDVGSAGSADSSVYSRQIAEALEAPHVKDILHRHLRPENLNIIPRRPDQDCLPHADSYGRSFRWTFVDALFAEKCVHVVVDVVERVLDGVPLLFRGTGIVRHQNRRR